MKKYFAVSIMVLFGFIILVTPIYAHNGIDDSTNEAIESARPSKSPRGSSVPESNRGKSEELKTMRADQLRTMKAEKEELKTMRGEMRSAVASARAEMKAKLCERVGERIGEISERYESNHKSHVEQYQKLKTKVQEMITKLKAQGLNTAGLEATLPTLDTKIKAVETQHALYVEKLKAIKALGCTATEAQIKAARDAAQAQLGNVRTAVEEVRNFYRTGVRNEIIKLKEQRASMSPKVFPTVIASPTNQ